MTLPGTHGKDGPTAGAGLVGDRGRGPDFALASYNRGITHARLDQDSVQAVADLIQAGKPGMRAGKSVTE